MHYKILRSGLIFLAALLFSLSVQAKGSNSPGFVAFSDLPREAQRTVLLIKENKTPPYPKDGSVFGNYESLLPKQKRGYYHEYTVKTPGVRSRGARRIVVGGKHGGSRPYYYTDDHYNSFRQIKE